MKNVSKMVWLAGMVFVLSIGISSSTLAQEELADDRFDGQRVPILSDVPVVGRLFIRPSEDKPEYRRAIPVLSDLPHVGQLFRRND